MSEAWKLFQQPSRDAKENAKLNEIEQCGILCGKSRGSSCPEKYEKNGVYADVIVVDPPRKGCDEILLETMVKMQPERIVYVSCDSCHTGTGSEVSVWKWV